MNSKTNQKINQVSEKTLVIGIDIAKRTHACAVDDRGCVLQKTFPFSQKHSSERWNCVENSLYFQPTPLISHLQVG